MAEQDKYEGIPWREVADAIPRKFERNVGFVGPLNLPHGSAEYIVKKLQNDAGLTLTAALGVVANLKAESGLDPAKKQYSPKAKDGIGKGRGLAQWEEGGRFDGDTHNLVKYAKSKGKRWDDFDTQIGFIGYEFDNLKEYGAVRDAMNKAKTVDEATEIFLDDYEKAGDPHLEDRLQYGRDYYDEVIKIPGSYVDPLKIMPKNYSRYASYKGQGMGGSDLVKQNFMERVEEKLLLLNEDKQ
jgi:hypothetical protein